MISCKIKSITKFKKNVPVYDIVNVPNHNYIANCYINHNCDEAVRFACLDGDTKIKTPQGLIEIKKLENKKFFQVCSFNEVTKQEEIQIAETCLKIKEDGAIEVLQEATEKYSPYPFSLVFKRTGLNLLIKEIDTNLQFNVVFSKLEDVMLRFNFIMKGENG